MANVPAKKERYQVVEMLNQHYGTYLWPEAGSEKWFKDDRDRNYVVLVGRQNRHYIAKDTIEDEAGNEAEGVLAIGQTNGIDVARVFVGSLRPLADLKDQLMDGYDKDFYRFMSEEDAQGRLRLAGKGGRSGRGGHLGCTLTRLGKMPD